MNRTPIKRTPFKRKAPAFACRPEREYRMPTVSDPAAFRSPAPVAATAAPIRKADPVRSEAYRRAVAGLRCIHCGVLGYSQCAHANTGKGGSLKVCDLQSFPLCTVHPGPDGVLVQGCHERFDQGALFSKETRRALEPAWIESTQRKILSMGLWPRRLARPSMTAAPISEIRP